MSARAAVLLALLLAAPARAAAESPISGSFELRVGTYRPSIGPEGSTKVPYQTAFGTSRPTSFKLHVARSLPWRTLGSLELGLGAGWWQASGPAVDADTRQPTGERTGLRVVPTQLTATWRLDLLWERFSVPLVPYARASLERYHWWATGPGGKTDKSGATNGYAWGGGLGFVLDVVDPTLARELDVDSGVNHTIVTLDVSRSSVHDFGSEKSWDMSDRQTTISVGLLFVY